MTLRESHSKERALGVFFCGINDSSPSPAQADPSYSSLRVEHVPDDEAETIAKIVKQINVSGNVSFVFPAFPVDSRALPIGLGISPSSSK